MRLPRPYTPYRLRVQVAENLFKRRFGGFPIGDVFGDGRTPLKVRLNRLLLALFGDVKVHLHHRPALCNRERRGDRHYYPDANDPDYLVFLPAAEHDIETRVRGQHGQHSDQGLLRKSKRIERKRKRPRKKLRSRGFDKSRSRKFSGQVVPRDR